MDNYPKEKFGDRQGNEKQISDYLVVKHHDTISFALKYCTVYMYLFDMRKIFIQNLWVGVCTNKPLNHV